MKHVIHTYIDEINEFSKQKIDIVLFEDAIILLAKINRIISLPFGHSILVGLGGSGRHTMTRLASYMQDYNTFEVNNNDILFLFKIIICDYNKKCNI